MDSANWLHLAQGLEIVAICMDSSLYVARLALRFYLGMAESLVILFLSFFIVSALSCRQVYGKIRKVLFK